MVLVTIEHVAGLVYVCYNVGVTVYLATVFIVYLTLNLTFLFFIFPLFLLFALISSSGR